MDGSERLRERRYPAQVTARIPQELKARLEVLADREGQALGRVLRRVLEAGVGQIEDARDRAGSAALAEAGKGIQPGEVRGRSGPDARQWWSSLDRPSRSRWGRELAHLEGPEFLEEAYRRAQESADQG